MALSFNPLIAGKLNNARGVPWAIMINAIGSPTIRLYPSTVAFPSTAPSVGSGLPAGYIAQYTNVGLQVSTTGLITSTGVNTSVNTTAAGTIAWASIVGSNATAVVITDSVVLNGNNGIIAVSPTLTPTSGQMLSITFSFKVNIS